MQQIAARFRSFLFYIRSHFQPPLPPSLHEVFEPSLTAIAEVHADKFLMRQSLFYLQFWMLTQFGLFLFYALRIMTDTSLLKNCTQLRTMWSSLFQLSVNMSIQLFAKKFLKQGRINLCRWLLLLPYVTFVLCMLFAETKLRGLIGFWKLEQGMCAWDAEGPLDSINYHHLRNVIPNWELISIMIFGSIYYCLFCLSSKGPVRVGLLAFWFYFAVLLLSANSLEKAWTPADFKYWFGVLPFCFGALLIVHVKSQFDHMQKAMFCAVESMKSVTINERILRCEAEFQAGRSNAPEAEEGPEKDVISLRSPSLKESHVSCPPTLFDGTKLNCSSCWQSEALISAADCLPETCQVWTDGKSDAARISEVKPGDNLLCLDVLTNKLKYASVKSLTFRESDTVERLAVVLEDGSNVTLTADHPVQVKEESHKHTSILPACKLIPGAHRMTCFRMVDLKVKTVNEMDDTSPRLASLSMMQSRYHVLAADPTSTSPFEEAVAVGSSDLMCHSAGIRVNEHHGKVRGLRRSISSPDLGMATQNHKFLHGDRADSTSQVTSKHSSDDCDIEIVLGKMSTAARPNSDPSVTGFREMCLQGTLSLGSMLHQDKCYPCSFDKKMRSKGGRACTAGASCAFCHLGNHNRVSKSRSQLRKTLPQQPTLTSL